MKRRWILFAAMLCLATSSFATVHMVSVADFAFSPATLTVHTGDTVMWMWVSGTHTTTSIAGGIPAGAVTWDHSMTSSSSSFIYVPTIAGTYNYECTIHASMGMVGSFTVTNSSGIAAVEKTPGITAYPNPANEFLHVVFGSVSQPSVVSIVDIAGREMMRKEFIPAQETNIDLTEVPNGHYFLSVEQGGKVSGHELVVHH